MLKIIIGTNSSINKPGPSVCSLSCSWFVLSLIIITSEIQNDTHTQALGAWYYSVYVNPVVPINDNLSVVINYCTCDKGTNARSYILHSLNYIVILTYAYSITSLPPQLKLVPSLSL